MRPIVIFAAVLAAVAGTLESHAGQFDPVTRTIEVQYDAYGSIVKEVIEPNDPTLRVTTDYERPDAYGLVRKKTVSWIDPITGVSKSRDENITTYDARRRFVETQSNAAGHQETRQTDEKTGNTTSLTGPNLLTTKWTYDGWGRLVREDRADGTATTTAYKKCVDSCAGGAVLVRITQNWIGTGTTTQTTVPVEEFADSSGRVIRTRTWGFSGTEVLTERVYDSLGRLERIARPRFAGAPEAVWTWYDRDPIGRVVQLRSPDQAGTGYDTTSFTYDGLRLVTTNAKSQKRVEWNNAIGRLKSVTDDLARITNYLYEPFGNLTRTVDPRGNQINIFYDRLGRKVRLEDPDLGVTQYVLDPLGQTRRETDNSLQATTFEFDVLGRVVQRLEPDLDSRWEYDTATKGIGKLAEAFTWAAGTKDYRRIHTYDGVGRPSSVTTRLDWDYTETSAYDAFGRASSTTHQRNAIGGSGGPSNTFHVRYNANGYLHQIDRHDGSLSTVWQGLIQDAEGRFTSEKLGNGLLVARAYNGYTGRLLSIQSGPSAGSATHQNDSYAYDSLGNLLSRTQLVSTAGALLSESFTYDRLNRLETSTIGTATKSVSYDELGNIASKSDVGSYSYPPTGAGSVRPHAVSAIGGTVAGMANPTFSYDVNGNLLTGLGRAYAWTASNGPQTIEKLSGGVAVERTAFIYGPEHQRLRQTVSPMSGGTPGPASRTIWYAGAIEKEVDASANVTRIRTDLPAGLGFLEEQIVGTTNAPGGAATRVTKYFLSDHLGSPAVIVDAAQSVVQRLSYDAWGRRRNADGADDAGGGWGSLKNNHNQTGYTGHEHLDQLGLIHMNARLYDPLIGRHTTADPTVPDPRNPQALNRYTYVLNNALAFTDPSGLTPNPVMSTFDNSARWGHRNISSGAEDTTGSVRLLAMRHAALFRGRADPTFDLLLDPAQWMAELGEIEGGFKARFVVADDPSESLLTNALEIIFRALVELALEGRGSSGDMKLAMGDAFARGDGAFPSGPVRASAGGGAHGVAGGAPSVGLPPASLSGAKGVGSSAEAAATARALSGVPGRVSSRINLSREGMEHVVSRHLSGKGNASQFSISEAELRAVLTSRAAVNSPVVRTVHSEHGVRYVREFDAGRIIGTDRFSGNQQTSIMTILTDRFGNLVSSFPGLLK